VLLVDDNRDFADSLGVLLRHAGAQTEIVYDGPSALAAIALRPPEVVLVDLGMSGMDGYALDWVGRLLPKSFRMQAPRLTGPWVARP
jgi:CheY-like chemotaxis protein